MPERSHTPASPAWPQLPLIPPEDTQDLFSWLGLHPGSPLPKVGQHDGLMGGHPEHDGWTPDIYSRREESAPHHSIPLSGINFSSYCWGTPGLDTTSKMISNFNLKRWIQIYDTRQWGKCFRYIVRVRSCSDILKTASWVGKYVIDSGQVERKGKWSHCTMSCFLMKGTLTQNGICSITYGKVGYGVLLLPH